MEHTPCNEFCSRIKKRNWEDELKQKMKSKIDTNWDVMKYKYHYELEHQWNLKRKFIEAHKDKYPEDRLVCLAQLYCNVHFMGCSYEDNIMKLIDELSEGIAEKNSKWQKQTFVTASNAVEARVKDRLERRETQCPSTHIEPLEAVCNQSLHRLPLLALPTIERVELRPEEKRIQTEQFKKRVSQSKLLYYISRCINPEGDKERPWEDSSETNFLVPIEKAPIEENSFKRKQKNPVTKKKLFETQIPKKAGARKRHALRVVDSITEHEFFNGKRRKTDLMTRERAREEIRIAIENSPFAQLVVYRKAAVDEMAIHLMSQTSRASNSKLSYTYSYINPVTNEEVPNKFAGKVLKCNLHLDGMLLSSGIGAVQKQARDAACKIAIERLKETSFTILVKAAFSQEGDEVSRDLDNGGNSSSSNHNQPITDDNIGNKMMKLMGWGGGGLGKNQQGIAEPISAAGTVKREGLGLFGDFNKKIQTLLSNFSSGPSKDDLVFSTDFSREERKTIHEMVRKYNLKSRSYGNNENRRLVVFKKMRPLEVVEDLLMAGCETTKYKLLPPKSLIDRFTA